ncbi:DUF6152 family protein [Sphingobium nicotianae]|uniref:DUF5666 domain-containing protein n=1 Tax=Sphingobium nicotianae TaxID=2782607 RepID=A0A9X1AJZ3_9SPHN|nr:DUF6152 family protein [Sphingobium nicotianae]MBT2185923.1 hypothetical protein [Sphingobium nicotianae]
MIGRTALAVCAMTLLCTGPARAHHSFAAFFDPDRLIRIKGTVTDFHFTNPHGTIGLDVRGSDGKVQKWRAETNAPVVLMRRGWTRTSVKPGDVITIEGWSSRDGKPYLRLKQAFDASGKAIGAQFGQTDS